MSNEAALAGFVSMSYPFFIGARTSKRSRRRARQRSIAYAKVARTVHAETRLLAALFGVRLEPFDTFETVRARIV